MLVPHQPLLNNAKLAVEQGLGKGLPPGPGKAQLLRQLQGQLGGGELAVAEDLAGKQLGADPLLHRLLKGGLERRQRAFGDRQAGGHGVAAKLGNKTGVAAVDRFQQIPQVHAGNGAARALELVVAGLGKGDHRPVILLLDARGHQPHHPLMPVVLVQHQPGRQRTVADAHFRQRGQGFLLHAGLNGLALPVELVHLGRQPPGFVDIVTQQTGHSHGHIVEPAHGIKPRPQGKAQIGGHQPLLVTPGNID